ncbi:hypothetical protein SETIT_8G111200v2 [Setaria italica]|uniref:4-coumarate--CoA ligase n=1 Tax=Setaria italica TaxID=4555 RepID=A0A368S6J2_SETIT|nr:4-coumarate--CoA ligase-like 7 isoform X2 [Setaria italica]RCV38055.1 hypothetical protein SETIT_8G111200v2 [Setaria italica]
MATPQPAASADGCATAPGAVDSRSGYCKETKTFCSLRPPVPLPPAGSPLSFTAFAFSLLPSPLPAHPALLDAATGETLSFPAFRSQVRALAGGLRSRVGVRRGDVAFVLAPARLDVPVLYFALLSFGAVVSPANPALTAAEVARIVALSDASVAFAVSSTAAKLPAGLPTVLLDSDHFRSFLHNEDRGEVLALETAVVHQSETAAIQYSSGTTGRVKAAALSHRNFTAMAAGSHALAHKPRHGRDRMLLGAPMFHSLGFYYALKGIALGQTTVLVTDTVARRGVKGVVEAAERWAVSEMTASPPVVIGMAKERCDLEALERVVCGGAPLPTTAAEMFRRRFPNVDLCMGYGSTEAGGISLMIDREECTRIGSAGRVSENVEVKIVDHITGYVGDDEANASTFDSEGWLKTGDLCYVDQDGFLFVVDRLKELIKYKGYQVPPAELELVLQTLPEVVEAAVMPYPHEEAGQIPIALVVRKPGSKVTEAQVVDHVAKRVASYKKIRKVLFVDSIPKSPAGKILRRQLTKYVQFGAVSRL